MPPSVETVDLPHSGKLAPNFTAISFCKTVPPPSGMAIETRAKSVISDSETVVFCLSNPASGGVFVNVCSNTKTLSLGVDKMRRNDFDVDALVPDHVDCGQDFTLAFSTLFDKAKSDGMAVTG